VSIIISVIFGGAAMFCFMSLHERDAKKNAPADASAFLDKAITAIQARDYSAFESVTNLTTDIELLTLEYSHDLLAKDFKSDFSLDYISEIKISGKEVRYIWKAVSRETQKEGIISLWVSDDKIVYFKIEE
jgi:hypothetical protein